MQHAGVAVSETGLDNSVTSVSLALKQATQAVTLVLSDVIEGDSDVIEEDSEGDSDVIEGDSDVIEGDSDVIEEESEKDSDVIEEDSEEDSEVIVISVSLALKQTTQAVTLVRCY